VLRRIVGVVVGYVVFAGSAYMLFSMSHQQPHEVASFGFMVVSVLYGMLFAALGGYLAALIGGQRETSIAIAVIIGAGALVSLIADSGHSQWSQIAALVFMSPMAVVGGRLIKPREPFMGPSKKTSGTHLVSIPPKGFSGTELPLDLGSVDLGNFAEYRGYEAPQPDVVSLKWEGSDSRFSFKKDSEVDRGKDDGRIKRLDWVFEGVSFFDVGPRDPAVPESEDRTLRDYEVLDTDPDTRIRLKFLGGVIIEVAARSTHVVISS
jgi:hypothetical protein